MADNITLNSGTGGAVLAADDIGPGVWHQRVKIQYGTDGSATDVSDSNPLPIDDAGGSLTVDNGGTFAVQVDGAALTALQLIDDAIATTDAAAGASPVGVPPLAVRDDALSALTPIEGDFVPMRVGSTGALWTTVSGTVTVDGSGVTQPVSGTVTANLSATDNAVLDQIELNTDSLVVVGGGVESTALRVTLASDSTGVLSVDDNGGALTVDNGGTFAVQVDGAALTALQLIDNIVSTADAVAGAAPVGVAPLAVRDDALSALTPVEGDFVPLRTDANGALWVIASGASVDDTSTLTSGTTQGSLIMAAAVPTDTSVDANDVAAVGMSLDRRLYVQTVGPAAENAAAAGNPNLIGGRYDASPRTLGDGDVGAVAMDSDGAVHVSDGGNSLTVDNGGTFAVQSTLQAGSALVGDVGLSGARTSGGTTPYKSLDLDESEEEVKASAGQVYWIHCMNLAATKRYLKFYNATAANVTVGTTTPVMTFPIPTLGDTNGAGFVLSIPNGIAFSTAICVAATTGFEDADTGAPGANEVILNLGYA